MTLPPRTSNAPCRCVQLERSAKFAALLKNLVSFQGSFLSLARRDLTNPPGGSRRNTPVTSNTDLADTCYQVASTIGVLVDFSGTPRIGFAQYLKAGSSYNPQSVARAPDSQLEFSRALRAAFECEDQVKPAKKRAPKKTSRDESSPRRKSRQSRYEPRK